MKKNRQHILLLITDVIDLCQNRSKIDGKMPANLWGEEPAEKLCRNLGDKASGI
jgi:hypothetical protein